MKTVAIANASGGRGKTAVTKMLASLLTGLHHKRVLIFDVAESNAASTFDEVRTLKAQQSLATEDVGLSIPKPLAAMVDEDWQSLTAHLITRLGV